MKFWFLYLGQCSTVSSQYEGTDDFRVFCFALGAVFDDFRPEALNGFYSGVKTVGSCFDFLVYKKKFIS